MFPDVPATLATNVIAGAPFCAGSSISVDFTATGTFNPGNVFTAELSDASGSFASPVNIGTLSATASGTIAATIPAGTATGTGFRIRVTSSDPALTGTDNGSDFTIKELPVISASNTPLPVTGALLLLP